MSHTAEHGTPLLQWVLEVTWPCGIVLPVPSTWSSVQVYQFLALLGAQVSTWAAAGTFKLGPHCYDCMWRHSCKWDLFPQRSVASVCAQLWHPCFCKRKNGWKSFLSSWLSWFSFQILRVRWGHLINVVNVSTKFSLMLHFAKMSGNCYTGI